ncbi:hypothetical protein VSR68_10130 [Paraburkholderia phymatum]|uniref:hypothetical protein n=1 Tax=Paraburkholderia phymatum TaxID=148447 RepID=UPI00318297FD
MECPRALEFDPDHSLAQAREHRFALGGKRLVTREDMRESAVAPGSGFRISIRMPIDALE